jgi:alpha-beta hydrolase superfamily lysophospholipase
MNEPLQRQEEARMKHADGYFEGFKGSKIYFQCWLPESEPRAVLLVVHGLGEHSGRYMNVVDHFVPKSFAIYGLDHVGHGKSDGKRVFVERFDDFIQTLRIFNDMVQGWQPDRPIYLVGHSMGGLISAAYLLEYQDEVAGAVLSGPGIKVSDDISSATLMAARVISFVSPKSGLIQLDASAISQDPAVVDAYINDPQVHTGKITARLAAEMLTTMQQVTEQAGGIHLPLLIVQGGADALVDPSGAQMLYDRVSSEDKMLKIYEGLYHEVLNEPERERVLGDIETWLEMHLMAG